MELVILIGLQASGKSTFFRTYFANTHEHISKDLMGNNKNRNRRQAQLLSAALEAGRSVVVDNTNPTVEERAVLIQQGQSYGAEIIGYYFESNLKDCLKRNQSRTGKAKVPDIGIYATIKKLAPPSYTEGFHRLFHTVAYFDSRVWLGANSAQVVDYFSWRQADATRCALNGWCYWTLRKLGKSAAQATAELDNQSVAFKNELLFDNDINFNDLPTWQRRGTGLYWEQYIKQGYNPIRQEDVVTLRRRIKIDETLPIKEDYREFIAQILNLS